MEKIKNVANRVIEEAEKGNEVVVVVSAMGKTTDQLVSMARDISGSPSKRGNGYAIDDWEQVTISLLTMALIEEDMKPFIIPAGDAGRNGNPFMGMPGFHYRLQGSSPASEKKIVVVAGFGVTMLPGKSST